MKLAHVKIKNFRSIKESLIELEPACRVLVGINESGKSNVLKALRLLSDEFRPSRTDDVRERLAGEAPIKESYVRFQYRLEKTDTNQLKADIAALILCEDANPAIATQEGKAISLDKLCLGLDMAALHEVNILAEKRATMYWQLPKGVNLSSGWKKPSDECPDDYQVLVGAEQKALDSFKLVREGDFPDIAPAYLSPASTDDLGRLCGSAVISLAKRERPTVVFWQYDDKYLLPTTVDISTFAAKPDLHAPLKNMFLLADIPEQDIATSIQEAQKGTSNQIQNYLDHIADRTTEHFRRVWREYKNISFSLRLNGKAIIPGIKEANTHDFARRSDGFKRFVTFLLLISARVQADQMKDTLLIIDEPEISLHPSGARYLRDELLRIAKRNYVVYSTHSIFMIDPEDVGRHYVVTKRGEVTTLDPAQESNVVEEEVLWNALGYSAFSVLKEKNLIFEGWKDKRLFEVMTASAPSLKKKFRGIGIAHAKGASTIKLITPILQLAGRECLIVSDADEPAIREQKRHKADNGYGTWLTYPQVDKSLTAITGEDFVRKPILVKAVNLVLDGKSEATFAESDLLGDFDRLQTIKTWLLGNGITPSQLKDIVDAIKDAVFDSLTAKDIEPDYAKLLGALTV